MLSTRLRHLELGGLALATLALSCTSKTDGATPAITGVDPAIICTAQADQTITITGSGFSPAVVDGLTDDKRIVMPRVFLVGDGGETEIPADGISIPLGDASGTVLVAVIPQGLVGPTADGEAEAVYDIRIDNANGNSGSLSDALTVVPPPRLSSVTPTFGAQGTTVTVTLTGTGFRDGMTVTLDANPAVAGTDVVVSSTTEATATFDLSNVAEGVYSITVENTDGCTSTLEGAFTVFIPTIFELTGIEPPFGWHEEDTTVTIFSNGGFASTPRVEMQLSDGTGPVIQLVHVAFINADTITAVVPAGAALGLYDVTVINPPSDGGLATLTEAFEVVDNPVPKIEAISPSRGEPGDPTNVTIFGENFRADVRIELINSDLEVAETVGPVSAVTNGGTEIAATLTLDADLGGALPEGAYLVRVTNLDEGTYATFSAFIVASTGPSGNLHNLAETDSGSPGPDEFGTESSLLVGRRMLAGTRAKDTSGNTFFYAIGGDTGTTATVVLDTVEVSQVSAFGALSAWRDNRNTLNTPRVGAAAVAVPLFDLGGSPFTPIKTFIYVTGGMDDEGNVLGSVERAVVLSPDDAPSDLTAGASIAGGTLETGTWYYKVAAVLGADPDNPNGETLPSDEAIITIGGGTTSVDLSWTAVAGAVSYRIYRTDAVDGMSQTEHLIAEDVTGTTYTDTGDAAGTLSPLPPGATGVWQVDGQSLTTGRWGHQVALIDDGVPDSDDDSAPLGYFYVLGGKDDGGTYLDSVERADIALDGLPGAYSAASTTAMATPRAFFSLVVETANNVSTFSGGLARLFTLGGVIADPNDSVPNDQATDAFEMSVISDVPDATFGLNGTWTTYEDESVTNNAMAVRAGPLCVISSEKLFMLGGAQDADDTSFGSVIATGRDVDFDGDGTIGSPIQSAANSLNGPRALGLTLTGSGFIYFIGGTSDGDDALATTEKTF